MLRPLLSLSLIGSPAVATAHSGHLGELAGHDHWVAGIALGAAGAAALWGWLKGRGEGAADGEGETPVGAQGDGAEA